MNKKMLKGILILSFITVIGWMVGLFVIFVLDFENHDAVSIGWTVVVFIITLIISVCKNMKKGE
jgi:hypothetical protein